MTDGASSGSAPPLVQLDPLTPEPVGGRVTTFASSSASKSEF
jgi:hypothetical protein